MGAAAGTFEKAGNQNLVLVKDCPTNRADSVTIPAETVNAAPDVHEAVYAAVQ